MSDSKSGIVLELAEEFIERYRQGERPALSEYIDRHPELATEIQNVFPAMAMMENIALTEGRVDRRAHTEAHGRLPFEQLGDFRVIREVGRGGMGVVYEAEQVSLGRHVALKVLPPQARDAKQRNRFEREAKAAARLHHTNIVPVFGVGEQDGQPYYAMQFIQGLGLDAVLEQLRRLKNAEAIDGYAAAAHSLATGIFQPRDVEATSTSANESIAGTPENDTSVDVESPTKSSVVLPGQSEHAGTKRLTYWQSVSQIGIQVANALDYAHKQGILHRDIKPSNLLLDMHGTVWVTDFGLAKAEGQQDLTHTGDVLGTLRYMPPEAFDGRSSAKSDIYSLGLTIYELLAMKPAYDERDRGKLIKLMTIAEAPRLDRINREIPRDLATIVHKAIEKDPGHRYATAGEFAADLQRFLDDQPVRARRIGPRERLQRWAKRNPAVAASMLTVALVMAVGTIVSVFFAMQANEREKEARFNAAQAKENANAAQKAQQLAENERHKAIAASNLSNRLLHGTRMNLAQAARDAEDVRKLDEVLTQMMPASGEEDLRGWEWHLLRRLTHSAKRTLRIPYLGEPGTAPGVRFGTGSIHWSEDFRRVLSTDYRLKAETNGARSFVQETHVVDSATGKSILNIPAGKDYSGFGLMTNDGRFVAINIDGKISLWNLDENRHVVTMDPTGPVFYFQFDGTGTRLMTQLPILPTKKAKTAAQGIIVWEIPSGRELIRLESTAEGSPTFGSFTANVDEIFVYWKPKPAKSGLKPMAVFGTLIDLRTGKQRTRFEDVGNPESEAANCVFSPDGRWMILQKLNETTVWDLKNNAEAGRLERQRFSRNLAGGSRSTFFQKDTFLFSPDRRHMAFHFVNQPVVLWDLEKGKEVRELFAFPHDVTAMRFSPDGKELAVGTLRGSITIADIHGNPGRVLLGHQSPIQMLRFRKNNALISVEHERTLKEWDLDREPTIRMPVPNVTLPNWMPSPTMAVSASADGRRLALWFRERGGMPPGMRRTVTEVRSSVRVLDADSGRELYHHDAAGGSVIVNASLSKDGRRLAVQEMREATTQKQLSGPKLVLPWPLVGLGETLIAAWKLQPRGPAGKITVHDVDAGREMSWFGDSGYSILSFDATYTAELMHRGVRIQEIESHREFWLPNEDPLRVPWSLYFSPDNRRLAVIYTRRQPAAGAKGPKLPKSPVPIRVVVYDLATRESIFVKEGELDGNGFGIIRYLGDGNRILLEERKTPSLAFASSDEHSRRVRGWDLTRGSDGEPFIDVVVPGERPEGKRFSYAIEASRDGNQLAIANGNGTIEVWDLRTGRKSQTIAGYGVDVGKLVFSPNGKRLLVIGLGDSASADAGYDSIHVWDLATGQQILTLPLGPGANITQIPMFRFDDHILRVLMIRADKSMDLRAFDGTPLAEEKPGR